MPHEASTLAPRRCARLVDVPGDAALPSLDVVDDLAPDALPGFLADLAARLAHLAALQTRAAARLAALPPVAAEAQGTPGRLLSAQQLAALMGRSLDYVYRRAKRWPFVIREGRALSFDEAGYLRWNNRKQRSSYG